MKTFMALYMVRASAIQAMMKAPPEEMKAGMDQWMSWAEKHKGTIAELGAPLGKTKRIEASGMADMKNDITGYSILKGESADAVAKVFEGHPHLKHEGAWIELIEVMPLPGM